MFDLCNFVMTGLKDGVGKMPDYKIILNAVGWYERGVLTEEDLAEVQALIDAKNYVSDAGEIESLDDGYDI